LSHLITPGPSNGGTKWRCRSVSFLVYENFAHQLWLSKEGLPAVSVSPAGVEPLRLRNGASISHLGETAGVGRRAGSFCSKLSGILAEEPEGEAPQVKE
jgi:hypothetical protein